MAKVTFQYRATKDTGNLSIRLIHGTGIDYRVSTPVSSRKEYWYKYNKARTLKDLLFSDVKQKAHGYKLLKISEEVNRRFENDFNNGVVITRDWLKKTTAEVVKIIEDKKDISQIVKIQKSKEQELINYKLEKERSNLLLNAIENMISVYSHNKREQQKYNSLKKLIENYQAYLKTPSPGLKILELNQAFVDRFIPWGTDIMGYKVSYIKNHVKKLKKAAIYAYENDTKQFIEISNNLRSISGDKFKDEEKIVITLSLEELNMIDKTDVVDPDLMDAKKAILIGCETGLRYSDFNQLNDQNKICQNGIEYWGFKTRKTGKWVAIPITDRIKYLVRKYGVPKTDYPDNDVKLNRDIKRVCRYAELNDIVLGDKTTVEVLNGKRSRRTHRGRFPKYSLITSRTFRRSFATNYYGRLDTSLIMGITGHTSEKMLRAYINVEDDRKVLSTLQQLNKIHHQNN